MERASKKRPLTVTLIGCLYMAVGAIGFAYHLPELRTLQYDAILIELIRILALIAGAFMLSGHNWARWLAIFWIALHVVIGAFHGLPMLAIHGLFCAIISWCLFRPVSGRYFRPATG